MRWRVWTQLGLTLLLSLAALRIVPGVLASLFPPRLSYLETERAGETAYLTEPKLVVYARGQIDPRRDNLVLTGTSNVREGLRVHQLAGLPGDWAVHNLAIGASNPTQIRQLFSLLHEYPLSGSARQKVLLIGIWHGFFVDNERRWKGHGTDLELEQLRYGVYAGSPGKLRPRVPTFFLPSALALVSQSLTLTGFLNGLLGPVEAFFGGQRARAVAVDKNKPLLDEGKRAESLRFWNDYLGRDTLSSEQFDELETLAGEVLARGWGLVLVDMPLPDWHRRRSPYFADYQQRKRDVLARILRNDHALYIDLQNLSDERMFYDSAHPIPAYTSVWAARVSSELATFLRQRRLVAR